MNRKLGIVCDTFLRYDISYGRRTATRDGCRNHYNIWIGSKYLIVTRILKEER